MPEVSSYDAPSEASRDEAPRHAPEAARRLHPLTLLQRALVSLPGLLLLAAPLLLASGDQNAWTSLFVLVVYGLVALPIIVLRYLRLRYWITPKEIVIESGVLNRQHRSIPIERVQNVQIVQPMVPRLFGTAKVKIETAGSSNTEGVLEYVSLGEAQRIRQSVRAYQHRQPAATSEEEPAGEAGEEAAAQAEPEPLFSMTLSRVLLAGTFRFSLFYIAIVFSVFEYVPNFEERLTEWVQRGRWQWLADLATASPATTVFLTIIVAVLFGWLTGLVLTLNRYYGFRLWLEEGKLHRRHGLLTLSEGTIPIQKVQALLLRTNPLMRLFGFYRLELQTMGLDVKQNGHQVAVPLAGKGEILRLAQHIRSFDLPKAFAPVSTLTIRGAFARYVIALVVVVAPLAYFLWPPAWWGLAAVPLLAVLAVLRWRNLGYALDPMHLYVRRGVFRHTVWVLPTEKHQVFYADASVFQRRLRLKSLHVDTAGAASFSYPEVPDLPAPEADDRMAQLYARFQSVLGSGF